jgi:hypothetical protein
MNDTLINLSFVYTNIDILESLICRIVTVSTLHGTLCLVRALIWPFGSSTNCAYVAIYLRFCLSVVVFVLVSVCHIVFRLLIVDLCRILNKITKINL